MTFGSYVSRETIFTSFGKPDLLQAEVFAKEALQEICKMKDEVRGFWRFDYMERNKTKFSWGLLISWSLKAIRVPKCRNCDFWTPFASSSRLNQEWVYAKIFSAAMIPWPSWEGTCLGNCNTPFLSPVRFPSLKKIRQKRVCFQDVAPNSFGAHWGFWFCVWMQLTYTASHKCEGCLLSPGTKADIMLSASSTPRMQVELCKVQHPCWSAAFLMCYGCLCGVTYS